MKRFAKIAIVIMALALVLGLVACTPSDPTVTPQFTANGALYLEDGLPSLSLLDTDTAGTLSWTNGQELRAGEGEYEWSFTSSDTTKYGNMTGKVKLTFTAVERLEITHAPNITQYAAGATFDVGGLEITAVYDSFSNGARRTIPIGQDNIFYQQAGASTLSAGDDRVTVVYAGKTVDISVSVGTPNSVVGLSINGKSYDGQPVEAPSFALIHGDVADAVVEYRLVNAAANDPWLTEAVDAGQWTARVTSPADSGYISMQSSTDFAITPATIGVSTSFSSDVHYGDTLSILVDAATSDYSHVVAGETPSYDGSFALEGMTGNVVNVLGTGLSLTLGTLTLVDNGDFKASNYSLHLLPGIGTINALKGQVFLQAALTHPVITKSWDSTNSVSTTIDNSFLNGAPAVNFVSASYASTDVANSIVVTATFSLADAAHYEWAPGVDGSVEFDGAITKASVSISSFALENKIYDGSDLEPSISVSHNVSVGYSYKLTSTVGDSYIAGLPASAGEYTVKASVSGNDNFSGDIKFAAATISKATLEVAFMKPEVVYAGADYDTLNQYSLTGFVGSDTEALTVSGSPTFALGHELNLLQAGTYEFDATYIGGFAAANYSFVAAENNRTSLTVTEFITGKLYNGATAIIESISLYNLTILNNESVAEFNIPIRFQVVSPSVLPASINSATNITIRDTVIDREFEISILKEDDTRLMFQRICVNGIWSDLQVGAIGSQHSMSRYLQLSPTDEVLRVSLLTYSKAFTESFNYTTETNPAYVTANNVYTSLGNINFLSDSSFIATINISRNIDGEYFMPSIRLYQNANLTADDAKTETPIYIHDIALTPYSYIDEISASFIDGREEELWGNAISAAQTDKDFVTGLNVTFKEGLTDMSSSVLDTDGNEFDWKNISIENTFFLVVKQGGVEVERLLFSYTWHSGYVEEGSNVTYTEYYASTLDNYGGYIASSQSVIETLGTANYTSPFSYRINNAETLNSAQLKAHIESIYADYAQILCDVVATNNEYSVGFSLLIVKSTNTGMYASDNNVSINISMGEYSYQFLTNHTDDVRYLLLPNLAIYSNLDNFNLVVAAGYQANKTVNNINKKIRYEVINLSDPSSPSSIIDITVLFYNVLDNNTVASIYVTDDASVYDGVFDIDAETPVDFVDGSYTHNNALEPVNVGFAVVVENQYATLSVSKDGESYDTFTTISYTFDGRPVLLVSYLSAGTYVVTVQSSDATATEEYAIIIANDSVAPIFTFALGSGTYSMDYVVLSSASFASYQYFRLTDDDGLLQLDTTSTVTWESGPVALSSFSLGSYSQQNDYLPYASFDGTHCSNLLNVVEGVVSLSVISDEAGAYVQFYLGYDLGGGSVYGRYRIRIYLNGQEPIIGRWGQIEDNYIFADDNTFIRYQNGEMVATGTYTAVANELNVYTLVATTGSVPTEVIFYYGVAMINIGGEFIEAYSDPIVGRYQNGSTYYHFNADNTVVNEAATAGRWEWVSGNDYKLIMNDQETVITLNRDMATVTISGALYQFVGVPDEYVGTWLCEVEPGSYLTLEITSDNNYMITLPEGMGSESGTANLDAEGNWYITYAETDAPVSYDSVNDTINVSLFGELVFNRVVLE